MPELDIYDELRNVVRRLDEHEIDYALCGGLAMAIHGRPRSTIDIRGSGQDQDDIKALQAGDSNAER